MEKIQLEPRANEDVHCPKCNTTYTRPDWTDWELSNRAALNQAVKGTFTPYWSSTRIEQYKNGYLKGYCNNCRMYFDVKGNIK